MGPAPHRSLVFRLTAAYLAAAGVVLLVSSLALYWTLARNLSKVELRLLDQKIDLFLSDQAFEPGDDAELFKQLSVGSQPKEPQEYWVRFLDPSGKIMAETPGMSSWLPPESIAPQDLTSGSRMSKRVERGDGGVFKVRSAWSPVEGRQQRGIEIALDCGRDEELLQEYRRRLALVVLLALVFLAACSALIARKGLQPLDELGAVLRSQSAHSLSVPLDPGQWPAETRQVIAGYNDLSQRLHESFLRLSQFSADLAHELRTPIHNLRLQADVILARPRKSVEYRRALEAAQEEYGRLTRMTESLLFLARAENGRQSLVVTPFEARDALRDAALQFKALTGAKGLKVAVQGRGLVHADRSLLQLALGNLLANACAHTQAGGRILLKAERLDPAWIRLSVSDNGDGIPAGDLPKVFDRFFRGDPARSKAEGSGLGLSIVAAIMDLHGGKVQMESKEGRGSTVSLDLPDPALKN